VAKASGVLAGLPVFEATFRACDPECTVRLLRADGDVLVAGDRIAEVEGKAQSLLLAERTALNFLQRMCGVATATARLVGLAAGRVRILDTRKTTPGLRAFEKYAVRCGGGDNHRFGLYDQVMIKENHIDLSGSDCESVTRRVRAGVGAGVVMTVEARDPEEARAAIRGGADVVLLDNMTPSDLTSLMPSLRALAQELGSGVQFEASGGIDRNTLEQYAAVGIDRVSIGALTHSSPSLDLSLYMEPLP
jgi:nicotinate-nucleotide pyrophosphorylase (carboxylating)